LAPALVKHERNPVELLAKTLIWPALGLAGAAMLEKSTNPEKSVVSGRVLLERV
jgi:hypothetical protein